MTMDYDDPNRAGGRVYDAHPSHDMTSPLAVVQSIATLLVGADPDERVKAYELAGMLVLEIRLPPATWCCVSRISVHDRPHVWSAHYTREQAERWLAVWEERRRASRTWSVEQVDDVLPNLLRRANADPERCIS